MVIFNSPSSCPLPVAAAAASAVRPWASTASAVAEAARSRCATAQLPARAAATKGDMLDLELRFSWDLVEINEISWGFNWRLLSATRICFFSLSLSLSLSLSFSLSLSIAICQDCRLGFDGCYFRKTNATNNSHDRGWFVQPIKMVILVMVLYWGLPMFTKLLHFHIMKTNYTLVSSKMANENPENHESEH